MLGISTDYAAAIPPNIVRARLFDLPLQLRDTAPILDEVDITYTERQFNGSFTQEDIYRQDPSKEVDRAWEALGISSKANDMLSCSNCADA